MLAVRYIHPGTGAVHAQVLVTLCPVCVRDFTPSEHELQQNVGDSITVHCPECQTLALTWAAPQPVPEFPTGELELEPEPEPA